MSSASASKVPLTSSSWTMGIRVGNAGLDAKQSSKVTWVSPGCRVSSACSRACWRRLGSTA